MKEAKLSLELHEELSEKPDIFVDNKEISPHDVYKATFNMTGSKGQQKWVITLLYNDGKKETAEYIYYIVSKNK